MLSTRILILVGLFCFKQSAVGQLASGLTAYWPLDGTLEDKAGDISGSSDLVSDDMRFVRTGARFDKGFLGTGGFISNGIACAEAADSIDFKGRDGHIAVSTWVKFGIGKPRFCEAILTKGEGGNFRLHRYFATNTVSWSSGGDSGNEDVYKKSIDLNDGQWHHVVAHTAPTALTIYIDGRLAARKQGVFNLENSKNPVQLGGNPDVSGRMGNRTWRGEIDDVAIWNRMLTSDEVRQIYEAGINGKSLGEVFAPQKAIDDDNDGLAMDWEIQYGLEYEGISGAYGDDGADGDPDGDGLINIQEQKLGTNPTLADTDGDGIDDGDEVKTYKTSPIKVDTDGDGFDDRRERVLGSDPNNSSSTPVSN